MEPNYLKLTLTSEYNSLDIIIAQLGQFITTMGFLQMIGNITLVTIFLKIGDNMDFLID